MHSLPTDAKYLLEIKLAFPGWRKGKYTTETHITFIILSDHSSLTDHSIKDIELIPLEVVNSDRDGIRKIREGFLISKGKTLEPYGMNRRDEI